jgi:diguanylate cyclase (GGDEF)-like protein
LRVFTCLVHEHNLALVLLAAFLCVLGSFVSIQLFRRTLQAIGGSRFHWCFLASVCAGSSIWGTHFIAMLGYQPGVPVTFHATLTIVSVVIAIGGVGIGLMLSCLKSRWLAAISGGGTIGISISAMHYVGMFAYRADGIVTWLPGYVAASILFAVIFGGLAIDRLRAHTKTGHPWMSTGLLVAAIVMLHFVGMAAFSVAPIAGFGNGPQGEAFTAMASAIALAALLIVGTGVSTHLVEMRTRVDAQNQLHHIAMHDALTGLENRHAFGEKLRRRCHRLDGGGPPFALLMVDLDRFKPINDTFGHPFGDMVLKGVARRLQRAIRQNDIVARIGGDEFAIIADGLSDPVIAAHLAERIVEVLSRPFIIGGQIAELGASVGITRFPEDGIEADLLIQHVDLALYTAKSEGRGRHSFFDPSLIDSLRERRALEAELRRACMREEFEVHFQPVLDTHNRTFIGAEALARWHSATRGNVSPSEFIPIAEELGLVSSIGSLVLDKACEAAATWPDHLTVAVNVSPVQIMGGRLATKIAQALRQSGLAPHRLEIEITETALIADGDLTLRTLQEVRALGVKISLDDFGTGYSSLSYLHRFPIDRIKIDSSFVNLLPHDADSASIVRAIAQLGANLKLQVTAEGIETAEQYDFIANHGCGHMQGFLFSKPIDGASVARLFRDDYQARSAA